MSKYKIIIRDRVDNKHYESVFLDNHIEVEWAVQKYLEITHPEVISVYYNNKLCKKYLNGVLVNVE